MRPTRNDEIWVNHSTCTGPGHMHLESGHGWENNTRSMSQKRVEQSSRFWLLALAHIIQFKRTVTTSAQGIYDHYETPAVVKYEKVLVLGTLMSMVNVF